MDEETELFLLKIIEIDQFFIDECLSIQKL